MLTGRFRKVVPLREQGREDDIQCLPLAPSFSSARKTRARCGNISWPQNTAALRLKVFKAKGLPKTYWPVNYIIPVASRKKKRVMWTFSRPNSLFPEEQMPLQRGIAQSTKEEVWKAAHWS